MVLELQYQSIIIDIFYHLKNPKYNTNARRKQFCTALGNVQRYIWLHSGFSLYQRQVLSVNSDTYYFTYICWLTLFYLKGLAAFLYSCVWNFFVGIPPYGMVFTHMLQILKHTYPDNTYMRAEFVVFKINGKDNWWQTKEIASLSLNGDNVRNMETFSSFIMKEISILCFCLWLAEPPISCL